MIFIMSLLWTFDFSTISQEIRRAKSNDDAIVYHRRYYSINYIEIARKP